MPDKWQTSVIISIFQKMDDVMSCESYRRVKQLEHVHENC